MLPGQQHIRGPGPRPLRDVERVFGMILLVGHVGVVVRLVPPAHWKPDPASSKLPAPSICRRAGIVAEGFMQGAAREAAFGQRRVERQDAERKGRYFRNRATSRNLGATCDSGVRVMRFPPRSGKRSGPAFLARANRDTEGGLPLCLIGPSLGP